MKIKCIVRWFRERDHKRRVPLQHKEETREIEFPYVPLLGDHVWENEGGETYRVATRLWIDDTTLEIHLHKIVEVVECDSCGASYPVDRIHTCQD